MNRFGFLAVALLASLGLAQENYTTWTGRKQIVLNTSSTGAAVTGNVTKVPVLVRLTPSNGGDIVTGSKGRGADLRFTKADSTTRLPHQIDRWDSAAQTADIWVLVDTVWGNNPNQKIRVFWNKTGAADSSNGGKVFDTANGYASVWHLGNTSDTVTRPNSIPGRFGAKPMNFASNYARSIGAVGWADSLTGGASSGATAYLAINEGTPSTYYNFPTGMFSYTAWVNATSVDNFARMISLVSDDGTAGTNRIFFSFNGGNIIGRQYAEGASRPTNSTTPMPVGVWSHLGMTITRGTADTTRLYLDGAMIQQTVIPQLLPDVARDYVRIGRDNINPTSDQSYNGKIDEARIARVAFSGDYIKLTAAIEKPGSTVLTLGAVTALNPASFSSRSPLLAARAIPGGMSFGIPAGIEGARIRLSIADMRGNTMWSRDLKAASAGSGIVWNSRIAGAYVARLTVLDAAGKTSARFQKTFVLTP